MDVTDITNINEKPQALQIDYTYNLQNIFDELFSAEHTSPTIEKELKQGLKQDNKQSDNKEGFSLDDITGNKPSDKNEVIDATKTQEEIPSEDFEETSEMIILGIDWLMIGLFNFMLKNEGLDKVINEDITTEKQRKRLIKYLTKVLNKYSIRLGVEMLFVLAFLSVYGLSYKKVRDNKLKEKDKKELPKCKTKIIQMKENKTAVKNEVVKTSNKNSNKPSKKTGL